MYEAIIKVRVSDSPSRRARDIAIGLSYAATLLCDEYGWTADDVTEALERVADEVHDRETAEAGDGS